MENRPYELGDDVEATGARLGKGAFASVKLVQHKPTGKHLALKVIDLNMSSDFESELAQIMTECQVHKSLSHPNVIYLYDYTRQDKKINLLLEYASKGDFYKYLQARKKISEEEALRVIFQLAQALKYLHSRDIIHRDLKLENVLIMEDGKFKLCDFGWCSPPGDRNRNILCGTYEYMAPEVARRVKYTSKVDTWSLGILAYELVHGYSPFAAPEPQKILANIASGEYDIDSSISTPYQVMIRSLIQADPQTRFSAEQLLDSHLFVAMAQEYCSNRLSVRPSYRPSMLPQHANSNFNEKPASSWNNAAVDPNQSVYLGPAQSVWASSQPVYQSQFAEPHWHAPLVPMPSYTPLAAQQAPSQPLVPTGNSNWPGPSQQQNQFMMNSPDFTADYHGPALTLEVEENFNLKDFQQFVDVDIDLKSVKDAVGEGLKVAGGFFEGVTNFFREIVQSMDDDKTRGRKRGKREEVNGKYLHNRGGAVGSKVRDELNKQATQALQSNQVFEKWGEAHPNLALDHKYAEQNEKRDSQSTSGSHGVEPDREIKDPRKKELKRANTEVNKPRPTEDTPWWEGMFGFLSSKENEELKQKLRQKEDEIRRRDHEPRNGF